MKPLAIDLFCGLGGWTDGLLAEGYDVIGFDIERHVYGEMKYPAQLVVQDVLTLHGSQFKGADLIVASPPCQEYSYMAMPWKLAKQRAAEYRSGVRDVADLTRLFDACFRIQREACDAAGRHIPLVVENVRGAQAWVGRARHNFGSFYLWGDVPAVMPQAVKARKVPGFRFDGSGRSFQSESVKVASLDGGRRTDIGKGARFTSRDCGLEAAGIKCGGDWFGSGKDCSLQRKYSGSTGRKMPGIKLSEVGFNVAMARTIGDVPPIKQTAEMKRQHIGTKRKMASALIAKIPFDLSRHIAFMWKPQRAVA